jgi:two-component system response regulator HydG
MVVLDTDGRLDLDDLPPELLDPVLASSGESIRQLPAGLIEHLDTNTSSTSLSTGTQMPDLIGRSMDDIERWAITETLKMTAGNREEAAKILDIGARTLYRKLDKYKQDESQS